MEYMEANGYYITKLHMCKSIQMVWNEFNSSMGKRRQINIKL